jgi:hypothetical protein
VTALAKGTELLQPIQPEDIIVSPRGGHSDFIPLSPYDCVEDNVGKSSLFLSKYTFNMEVASIL